MITDGFMTPDELMRLSRDYVLAHEGLTILSWDYVVENGKMFGESLWWDRSDGYYICDFSEDEEEGVYYTGLAYDKNNNGNLRFYRFYENGEEHGLEVTFYPSGEIKSYGVHIEKWLEGNYYEWYENGMIKRFIKQDKYNHCYACIECDENGNITQHGKA